MMHLRRVLPGFAKTGQRAGRGRRFVIGALALIILLASGMLAPRPHSAQDDCIDRLPDGCFTPPRLDVAFIVDRTGSMGTRGQTYNLQVQGIINSILDPTVIPRDGSISVSVVSFAEAATVNVPLTVIDSATAAQAVAAQVENLFCDNIGSLQVPCPFGGTSYLSGILTASVHLSQNRRQNTGQLIVLSTDGESTGQEFESGLAAVNAARNAAATLGIPFELDVMLMGVPVDSTEFQIAKGRADAFASPQPATDLPGTAFVIETGPCNLPGATDSEDCQRQAIDYANNVRRILRQGIVPRTIVVNTTDDTPPFTPIGQDSGASVSLRQAIELANCNGGEVTIRFAESIQGGTISPTVPLPALFTANNVIDGCVGDDCEPAVTIDGTSTTGDNDDGLVIRSSGNTVRGLRIINFDRAGITLEPLCVGDFAQTNTITSNVLEGNGAAGILVLNRPNMIPPDSFSVRNPIAKRLGKLGTQAPLIATGDSVGNTLSRNTFNDTGIPIDLGGDGQTPNDEGDEDEGPNRLLNFPSSISAIADENGFTITGTAVPGARVEIYGATTFDIDEDTGALMITGGVFLAEAIADSEGNFTVEAVGASPTGIYTATASDAEGNTSEFMFDSDAVRLARPNAEISGDIDFGNVPLNSAPVTRTVTVSNTGTAPLLVSGCVIAQCMDTDPDQTSRFSIEGCPTEPINPGAEVTITVTFTPSACGPALACLQLSTNDVENPVLVSRLTGNVTAGGQLQVTLEGGASQLVFGPVKPRGKPLKLKNQPTRSFTIANNMCDPATLTLAGIDRIGADVNNGKITNTNDSQFFRLVRLTGSVEVPVSGSLTLQPGEAATFLVRFSPVIPAQAGNTGLAASSVLPDVVNSRITFTQSGGGNIQIDLVGRVRPEFKLIDPSNPRNAPRIRLVRSGGTLTVDFSAWDPNQDVNRATYEFLDSSGRVVGTTFSVDLTGAIAAQNLARGQSFTVSQSFAGTGANRVRSVRITVSDGSTSQSATGQLNQ